MDIICPVCGEPWDMDCLHEEAEVRMESADYEGEAYEVVYKSVSRQFRTQGCGVALVMAYGNTGCKRRDSERTDIASALYDILGDDLDGAAIMMDDYC